MPFLVRKILEIDKLKSIIFVQNQLFLFNKMKRPTIYVDKKQNVISNLIELEDEILEESIDEQKIQKIYEEILQKEVKNQIDERLLEKISDEFFRANELMTMVRTDTLLNTA